MTEKLHYRPGERIGGYVIESDYSSGQEPKFLAKKAWTSKCDVDMLEPNHGYCQLADAFILARLKDRSGEDDTERFAANANFLLEGKDDYLEFRKKERADKPDATTGEIVAAFIEIEKDSNKEARREVFNSLKTTTETSGRIADHVKSKHDDFKRTHMVKLVFRQDDMGKTFIIGGKRYVRKPLARLRERYFKKQVKDRDQSGKEVWRKPGKDDDLSQLEWRYEEGITSFKQRFKILKKRFVEWWKAASPRDVNKGAATEALANNLVARMSGESTVTQDLQVVRAKYKDGTDKLLLDAKFLDNKDVPGADPEAQFRTFEDGAIREGYLIKRDKNGNPVDKDGQRVTGDDGKLLPGKKYVADDSIDKLGENLFPNLMIGDVDAIGKRGANRGIIDNYFANIDEGKALDPKIMKSDIIGNDFSIRDNRRIKLGNFYTNFSLFQDRPLSEKMRGVKNAKDMRDAGEDAASFNLYKETFDKKSGFDFRAHFEELHTAWNDRMDRLLGSADGAKPGVFTERLKVYDFDFAADDQVEKDKSCDQTFDILDNLEKLTSETSSFSEGGNVRLNRPRILDGKRQEWHVSQDPETKELVFSVTSGDVDEAQRQVNQFLASNAPGGQKKDGQRFEFRIPRDQVSDFADKMSNENLRAEKVLASW